MDSTPVATMETMTLIMASIVEIMALAMATMDSAMVIMDSTMETTDSTMETMDSTMETMGSTMDLMIVRLAAPHPLNTPPEPLAPSSMEAIATPEIAPLDPPEPTPGPPAKTAAKSTLDPDRVTILNQLHI